MGTRGFVGFASGGKETFVYNHFDSYPSGLGLDVLTFANQVESWDAVREQAAGLKHVSADVPPTQEDIDALAPWTNLSVSERSTADWYCLLRETQGDIGAILTAGYAESAPAFPYDSLFCEWGYLFDLDLGILEVYEGFQKSVDPAGRFGRRYSIALNIRTEGTENYLGDLVPESAFRNEYKPVKLVAVYPLSALPSFDDMRALERGEDDN